MTKKITSYRTLMHKIQMVLFNKYIIRMSAPYQIFFFFLKKKKTAKPP